MNENLTELTMKSQQIKAGIIGAGAIARVHAKCFSAFDDVDLVGVASSSKERAASNQAHFDVPVLPTYSSIIDNPDISLVSICNPSGKHLEVALEAARNGKHIICEKPLEITTRRVDDMISACQQAGVKLACIFQNRFNPEFQKLKAACSSNLFGRLLLANAFIPWYREPSYYSTSEWKGSLAGDGGAALINQGIHTVDLMLDIMGMPSQLMAQASTLLHDIEGEDLAQALLQFPDGSRGTILASTCLKPGYPERLEVYGEKGSAILEGGVLVEWNAQDSSSSAEGTEAATSGASDPLAIGHQWHQIQIADMIAAIREDRRPVVDGEEGRKSVAVIEAIYKAAKKEEIISV